MSAKEQAKMQLASIRELVADLESGDEAAYDQIHEDPLEVLVRSCWTEPGYQLEPCDFQILLCTGGPAVRIMGTLDVNYEPIRAWLEYQDWNTPWTEYYEEGAEEVLLQYASQFYYGEA
jgi:hypothetical protein